VTIAVEVTISSGHNFYVGRTRDISTGGLFIETPVGMDIGARVDVKLELARKRYSLDSEVVWVLSEHGKTSGVGVRFIDLPAAVKTAIEAFMKKRDADGISLDPEPSDADDETTPVKPPPLPR
jgi:uncharacterized protein (TIGR02266 family)